MKRTKGLIVAILCLALMLTSTLLVVAACGEEGYSITVLSYNEQQGSVKVSAPKDGKHYVSGEEVTVTVTPAQSYEVNSFKVNGTNQHLTDGSYKFNITQNTEIEVDFRETGFSVTVLPFNEQQGSVKVSAPVEGKLYDSGEEVTVTVTHTQSYDVSSFKVNGTEQQLTDGSYKFNIAQDTEILVTFKDVDDGGITTASYRGSWKQLNGSSSVEITYDEFKYNDTVCQVVQLDGGYAYKSGAFTTPFGFIDDEHKVLYVKMSASNWYLYTKDGVAPDVAFPAEYHGTAWDNSDMGRISVSPTGKAVIGNGETPLTLLCVGSDGTVFHILYNDAYWKLTVQSKSQLIFAQVGGYGSYTYDKVVATALPEDYHGEWTILDGTGTVNVDGNGAFTYKGNSCDVFDVAQGNYEFTFTYNNKKYALGLISLSEEGGYLLFVLDLDDQTSELYKLAETTLPDESVTVSGTDGEWQNESGNKLAITGGKVTFDGAKVYYFGQEYSSDAGGNIARAICGNDYYDIVITASQITLNDLFGNGTVFTRSGNSDGGNEEQGVLPDGYVLGGGQYWEQVNARSGKSPLRVTFSDSAVSINGGESFAVTADTQEGYFVYNDGSHELKFHAETNLDGSEILFIAFEYYDIIYAKQTAYLTFGGEADGRFPADVRGKTYSTDDSYYKSKALTVNDDGTATIGNETPIIFAQRLSSDYTTTECLWLFWDDAIWQVTFEDGNILFVDTTGYDFTYTESSQGGDNESGDVAIFTDSEIVLALPCGDGLSTLQNKQDRNCK